MPTSNHQQHEEDRKKFVRLLKKYEAAISSGEPVLLDGNELSEIADYYHISGQEEKAEDAIQLALSISPGAIGPLTYKIHEYLEVNDIETAKEYYSRITETDAPEYIYDWTEILLAQKKDQEAEWFLRKELEKVPEEELQDFIIDVAHIYEDWGFYDLAMKWIFGAQEEDSQDYKEIKAHTLLGLGKFDDSEKLFNELLDVAPYSTQYWKSLSNAQLMKGDVSKSIESSEYALAIDPQDTEAMIAKANGLSNLGNYEEALKYYRRALDAVPNDSAALLLTGICLYNLNKLQEATETLLRAKQQAQKSDQALLPDINHELALAYCSNKETDKALECIDELEKQDEDKAQIQLIKGHILLNAQRVEEAEKAFKQAVGLATNLPDILLHIAISYLENQMVKTSHKYLEKYFAVAPADTKDGYAYMAMCCYDLKDTKGFLKNLEKACRLNPQECQSVFSNLIPEEIAPEDYYNYLTERIDL